MRGSWTISLPYFTGHTMVRLTNPQNPQHHRSLHRSRAVLQGKPTRCSESLSTQAVRSLSAAPSPPLHRTQNPEPRVPPYSLRESLSLRTGTSPP